MRRCASWRNHARSSTQPITCGKFPLFHKEILAGHSLDAITVETTPVGLLGTGLYFPEHARPCDGKEFHISPRHYYCKDASAASHSESSIGKGGAPVSTETQSALQKSVRAADACGASDWKCALRDIVLGRTVFRLQIYDRPRSGTEFVMSAFDCDVIYCRVKAMGDRKYVCRCLPDTTVDMPTDTVDASGLRSCVPSTDDPSLKHDPYKVYSSPKLTAKAFRVGQYVEIQWKQRQEYAWGWWFGKIVSFDDDKDDNVVVNMEFEHYHEESPWRTIRGLAASLIVSFDNEKDDNVVVNMEFEHYCEESPWRTIRVTLNSKVGAIQSTYLGICGGIRPLSDDEVKKWLERMPREKIAVL